MLNSELDVANLVGVSLDRLRSILSIKKSFYTPFSIPKKNGGTRVISPPSADLKEIQARIKTHMRENLRFNRYAHGGVPGRSIKTNIFPHINKYMVVKIDIADFYPSISEETVFNMFKDAGYGDGAAHIIAGLTTNDNQLPQGASTSTDIANHVLTKLDKDFVSLSRRHSLAYTRYIDDITISGDKDLHYLRKAFLDIIRGHKFEVAAHKLHFMRQHDQQLVTGLVVNSKVRPPKSDISKLKKLIRNCWAENIGVDEVASLEKCSKQTLRNRILGKISNIKSVDKKLARTVRGLFSKIAW